MQIDFDVHAKFTIFGYKRGCRVFMEIHMPDLFFLICLKYTLLSSTYIHAFYLL